MTPSDIQPYVCEVEVIDVHAKANYGPSLKLRFADPEKAKLFRKGMRLQLVAVEIGDDEEVVPETRERPIQRKPYRLSQIAGMLATDRMWWRFVHDRYGELCESDETAAEWQRQACGVKSRSELDGNKVAAETFRRLLQEFDQWKEIDT
jgi:hypothetical protein